MNIWGPIGITPAVIAVLLVCAPAARAQSGIDADKRLDQIGAELQELKAQFVMYCRESDEREASDLERELRRIHQQQLRLQAEETALRQRMEQSDNPIAAPSADTDTARIEAARVAAFSGESQTLRNEQAALAERETETGQRLRKTRERLWILSQKAGDASARSGGTIK